MTASISLPIDLRAAHPAVREPRQRGGLLARYWLWLRNLEDAQRLREIEPHMARDVGVSPGADRCPDGFAVDPRPLWGIGLTPCPMDVPPAWPAASDGPRRGRRTE